MRRIYTVIERMLNAIPEDDKRQYAILVERLIDIQDKSRRRPPEAMPAMFGEVNDLLTAFMGKLDQPWKKEVTKILEQQR